MQVENVFFYPVCSNDYLCVVVKQSLGHRCGYVGVPEDHPLYKHSYLQELELLDNEAPKTYFKVHGGITYSDFFGERLHDSGLVDIEPKKYWFFGYDCNHACDIGVERSLEYCIGECKKLANQLKEVEFKDSWENPDKIPMWPNKPYLVDYFQKEDDD